LELGPEEYYDSGGIVFVEWADRITGLLPNERVEVEFEVTGPATRRITVTGTSGRLEELVSRAEAACG
jgi:tRNA threonylcarbamoyladenosine biosynthesis protein TsaE